MTDLHPAPLLPRRGLLFGAAASTFLAACGGGGSEPDGDPTIHEFSADKGSYFIGERARIMVRYAGASARLEPLGEEVANGALVTTGPLSGRQRLRLVVQAPGRPSASRDLWLDVRFRDRWQAAEDFTATCHAAVTTADGQVLVIGGSRGLGILSDGIDRFDAASGRFQRIGTLATGRSNHSALRLPDGRILVCGGVTSTPEAPFAELLDESNGASQRAGVMVEPRTRHAAAWLGDGRALVVGGFRRNSAEVWDPARRTWQRLASRMAHDREYHSLTELADGRVLVAGGDSTVQSGYVFAELFDPRTDTFTPLPGGLPERRQLHAAHRRADHSVLLLGGERTGAAEIEPLASVLRFDPATDRFTAEPALAIPRTLMASVRVPGDEVVLIGGQTPGELVSGSAAAWRAGEQRALAPLPGARAWHTANRLPDGRIVVIGGDDARGGYVSRTVVYD